MIDRFRGDHIDWDAKFAQGDFVLDVTEMFVDLPTMRTRIFREAVDRELAIRTRLTSRGLEVIRKGRVE